MTGATLITTPVRRRNKRSEHTIQTILAAAEVVILESGVERVSILDVCNQAGISRGTFYRYFSSQDELLEAFSRHKRDRFHESLFEALDPYKDPDDRFDALIRYMDNYLQVGQARKLLMVAPDYAIGWLHRIFHDSVSRFQNELAIVFDAWDERANIKIDRELVCELLIRYILSEQLVPSTKQARKALPSRIRRLLMALVKSRD
ncbi:TetR/AcrR family transcriptional regulator [Pseudomaricurvus hydrocarbonicus]